MNASQLSQPTGGIYNLPKTCIKTSSTFMSIRNPTQDRTAEAVMLPSQRIRCAFKRTLFVSTKKIIILEIVVEINVSSVSHALRGYRRNIDFQYYLNL
jgi:hypothetical protein